MFIYYLNKSKINNKFLYVVIISFYKTFEKIHKKIVWDRLVDIDVLKILEFFLSKLYEYQCFTNK